MRIGDKGSKDTGNLILNWFIESAACHPIKVFNTLFPVRRVKTRVIPYDMFSELLKIFFQGRHEIGLKISP
jgi:hypothetical protein